MNRLASAAVAVVGFLLCLVCVCGSAAFAQTSSADLLVRLDQLENQVRQLTGMVEQAQFRNQQLEATLRRMQEDYDYRFQELGTRGGARAPASPRVSATPAPPPAPPPVASSTVVIAAPPAAPATAPGRRSDAFDPNEHPGAPGAPHVLGSVAANTRGDGTPVIMSEEPRPIGAPLDLSTMAAPGAADPAARPLPPRGPNSAAVVATLPPSSTPRDNFDLGYGYVLRKDYTLAEDSFRDFLKRYPSDPLASEAQFWLGESLFRRQAFRDAADAFLAMSKKYETSAKAPDALLRLGQSLAALNEKELACATFGEVVRKYPRASSSLKQSVEREQKRGHC